MAAGHDRRHALAPGPEADHIADAIDADVETQLLHPAGHKVAAGLVLVGEREPGTPAALDGADLSERRDIAQKMGLRNLWHSSAYHARLIRLGLPERTGEVT